MHEAKIVVTQYLKNRNGIKKLAKEINFYKGKNAHIELNFAGATVLNSDFIFLFKRVRLSFTEFREIATVTDFDPLTVFDIAHEILNRSRIDYKRIAICLLILLSVGFGVKILVQSATSYFRMINVKSKIDYLIDLHSMRQDLNRYYLRKDIQLSNQNRNLDQTVTELAYNISINCDKWKTPIDLDISVDYNESNFKKFAKSDIPIRDKKGNILYYDHAYGWSQIYFTVWKGSLPLLMDIDLVYDSYFNIYLGCYILSLFIKDNKGDQWKALVNYNGGRKETAGDRTIINTESFEHVRKIFNDATSIAGIIYYNPKTKYLLK